MSKISICLGGVENGKMFHSDGEFYYVKNSNDLFTYKRVDLKFYRSVREDLYEYNYILRKPFNIYHSWYISVVKAKADEFPVEYKVFITPKGSLIGFMDFINLIGVKL